MDKKHCFPEVLIDYDICFNRMPSMYFLNENHSTGLYSIPRVEIIYFLNGNWEAHILDKTYELQPHDLIIIPENQLHSLTAKDSGHLKRFHLYVSARTLEAVEKLPLIRTPLGFWLHNAGSCHECQIHLDIHQHHAIYQLFQKYFSLVGYGVDILRLSVLLEIVTLVVQYLQAIAGIQLPPQSDCWATKVINYINEHFYESLSLTEIAQALFVSRNYVNSCFKAETGMTVHQYIIHRRVEKAKKVLHAQDTTPKEAFIASGFGDYSHFVKAFKKEVGVTPLQYKKNEDKSRKQAALMKL